MPIIFKDKHFITLLFLISIGAITRLYNMTASSYWLDELASGVMSNPSFSFIEMYNKVVSDVHPPLYQLLLWLAYKAFGYNELTGRALSSFFGIALLPAIYCLTKEMFNKNAGIIAVVLTVINAFLLKYAHTTRSYSLLALLTVCSFLFFHRLLENKSAFNLILYIVFSAALLNTHYFGFFIVAAQAFLLVFFILKNGVDKRLLLLSIIAGAILLLSISHLIGPILSHSNKSSFWIAAPSSTFFVDYILVFFGKPFSIFASLLIVLGVSYFISKGIKRDKIIILLTWIIIAFTLPYIRSITSTPILTTRNEIIVIPAFIILISFIISQIKPKLFAIAILATIIYTGSNNLQRYHHKISGLNGSWRHLTQEIIDREITTPIYSNKADKYSLYFQWLGSNIVVKPINQLESDLQKNQYSEVWILFGHNLQDKTFSNILDKNKNIIEDEIITHTNGRQLKQTKAIKIKIHNG